MTHNLRVNFIEGFRYLIESDSIQMFHTKEISMDQFSLNDYWQWSLEPDSMVLVRELDSMVAAVAYLTIHHGFVKVEMLGRNLSHPSSKGSGFDLLRFIETRVARDNGFKEVRLDSIDSMVEQYRKKGYVEILGASFEDPEWGVLTPMSKTLEGSVRSVVGGERS
jgi:hypothetical protein